MAKDIHCPTEITPSVISGRWEPILLAMHAWAEAHGGELSWTDTTA